MSDSFVTIILILIASVMIFMVPMIAVSHRKDVVSTQTVQAAINEFVDSTRKTGKVTQEEFSNLVQTLETTGETYEVNININNIDENPSKKDTSSVVDQVKIGENIYYTEYTTQVEKKLEENNGEIKLSTGDFVTVDVENKSQTMYQGFKKLLYSIVDTSPQISGTYGGMVLDEDNPNEVIYSEEAVQVSITYNRNADVNNIYWNNTEEWTADQVTTHNKNSTVTTKKTDELHRVGYKCMNWKTDQNPNSGDIIEGNSKITLESDMRLYANWVHMDNCTITYHANALNNANIINVPREQSVQYDEKANVTNQKPEDANGNYEFVGWSENQTTQTNQTDVVIRYYAEQDLGRITKNKDLYAVWKSRESYIRYKTNTDKEITKFPTPDTITGQNEDLVEITDVKAERADGIRFLGWSKNANAYEAEYEAGNPNHQKVRIKGRTELYAIWAEECEIIFDGNGGKVNYQGISENTISTNNVGSKVHRGETIVLPNATKNGRTLLGWSTNKNTTIIRDPKMKEGETFTVKERTILYAIWSEPEREYTIKFHGNGGTILNENSNDIQRTGLKLGDVITTPVAQREEYKFLGWSRNKNATSIGAGDIGYNSTVGRGTYTVTSDEEFWAVWQQSIIFSVTYNLNVNDANVYNIPQNKRGLNSEDYIGGYSIPVNPSRDDGYEFAGWTKTREGSGEAYFDGDKITIDGDIVLWAQWEIIKFRIVYNKNAQDDVIKMPQTEKVGYGEDYKISSLIPQRINKPDYKFRYWSTEPNGEGTKYSIDENNDETYEKIYYITKNITLYAYWEYTKPIILTLTGSKSEYYQEEETKKVTIMLMNSENKKSDTNTKKEGTLTRKGEYSNRSPYTTTWEWNIDEENEMELKFLPTKIEYNFYVQRKACVEDREFEMWIEASRYVNGEDNWEGITDKQGTTLSFWGSNTWSTGKENKKVEIDKLNKYKRYRVRFSCKNDFSDVETGKTTIKATVIIYN